MPTLVSDLKIRTQSQIAPGQDEEFFRIAAEADERLLELGKWHWTREKLELTVTDGLVELPEGYKSIVACRLDDVPKNIKWEESEYYDEGQGVIPIDGCRWTIVDQGLIEGVRTYKVTNSEIETVYALVKHAPVAVEDEDSELWCPSIPALKLMMMAIVYEEANELQKAMEYEMTAKKKLSEVEDAYRGIAKEIFKPSQYINLPRRSRTNFP